MATIDWDKRSGEELSRYVFNTQDIEAKTEVNAGQIEGVSKLMTYARITGLSMLEMHYKDVLVLTKSKDRASMGEFVNSLRSLKENVINKFKGGDFKLLG